MVYAYRIVVAGIDSRFFVRREERGVYVTLASSFLEREELWGGVANIFQKRSAQRTNGLMDSVLIGGAFHVRRELASEVGDQQYDLALSIIRGSRREFSELFLCLLQQLLQFNLDFWQPGVRWK